MAPNRASCHLSLMHMPIMKKPIIMAKSRLAGDGSHSM